MIASYLTQAALLLMALVAITPLVVSLRRRADARGRRDAAIALHRAQLTELDRDLAEGRIAATEHAGAVLEVQRRLLAIAEKPDPAQAGGERAPAAAVISVALIPLAALGLYMIDGRPGLPSAPPHAERLASELKNAADSEQMIDALKARIATLDPNSDLARQGYVLLGNAEESLGRLDEAAAAWRQAVRIRFDPPLAAAAAEAQTRVDGHVSPASAALFRRALAEGEPNAPWRKVVEQRLASVSQSPVSANAPAPAVGTDTHPKQ